MRPRQADTSCSETLAADVLLRLLWWGPLHKEPCSGAGTIAVRKALREMRVKHFRYTLKVYQALDLAQASPIFS